METTQTNKALREEVDEEVDLPLVNLTLADVLSALFVHSTQIEPYKDALLKLQTWIINFTEEQVVPLRELNGFPESEIETIIKKSCVISPITLSLYIHWLQKESFLKMTDPEKEKCLLEKMPGRLRARFRGNAACRFARELQPEEETIKRANLEEVDDRDKRKSMSFIEFLHVFGTQTKQELNRR